MQKKILKAKYHPKELSHFPFEILKVSDIRIIPSDEWIDWRSKQFGYKESFDNCGMLFPIGVTTHEPEWVKNRILLKKDGEFKNPHHRKEDGSIKEGYYVHLGNKRVWYAKQNGYTHIEAYIFKTVFERNELKYRTHIDHKEIPK